MKSLRAILALFLCLAATLASAQTGGVFWRLNQASGLPYFVQLNGAGAWLDLAATDGSFFNTLFMGKSSASANQKRWQWSTDASGQPILQLVNDSGAATTALTVTRSGSTPSSVIFGAPQGGTISSDGSWSLAIAGGRTAANKWVITDTYTGAGYGEFISYHKPQKTGVGGNVITKALLTRVSDFQGGGQIFHDWNVVISPLNPSSGLPGAPVGTQSYGMVVGEWNVVNRYGDHGYAFNRNSVSNWSGFWNMVPDTEDYPGTLGGQRVGYSVMFGFLFGQTFRTNTITQKTAKFYNTFLSLPNFIAPQGRFIRIFGGVSFFKSVSSIGAAGSGYIVGEVLNVGGGTLFSSFNGGQIEVTSVNGSGGITGAIVYQPGYYSALPSNPAAVAGGSGTGATINLTGSTSSDYPEAIMEIEGAWNKGIKLSGSSFVDNAVETPGFSVNNAGLVAATGLSFGSTLDAGGDAFSKHISLYGSTYGIGVTSGRINYVAATGSHRFRVNSVDVGWFDDNGVTALTLTLPHGSAPSLADGRLWTTTGGLFARINGATKTVGMLETANAWTPLQTFNGGINVNGGTLTSSAPTSIAQTWNNIAETFIGFGIDITDTNSAAGSQPFRIQLGGTPIFFVDKFGSTTAWTLSATGHVQTPKVYGGSGVASTLSLYSTAGAGTTDKIAFYSGSQVERWNIITSGHLKPVGGNTYDIGDSTNTVRDIFLAGGIYVGGATKVVGARITGWGAPTGTLDRTALAAYAGQTVSAGYVQAEAQATDDACKKASQELAAVLTDLRAHGLIGN